MSKLNKLIQELCPDGVEYRKLGEVCEFVNGFFHRWFFLHIDVINCNNNVKNVTILLFIGATGNQIQIK